MEATREHWDTALGGSCSAATTYKDKYLTLDFLSDAAKQSLVYCAAEALLCSVGTIDAARIHPDWIADHEDYVHAGIYKHALGGVLSTQWRDAFVNEFLASVTNYRWSAVLNENTWYDEQQVRKARAEQWDREHRERKIAEAKKVLEGA